MDQSNDCISNDTFSLVHFCGQSNSLDNPIEFDCQVILLEFHWLTTRWRHLIPFEFRFKVKKKCFRFHHAFKHPKSVGDSVPCNKFRPRDSCGMVQYHLDSVIQSQFQFTRNMHLRTVFGSDQKVPTSMFPNINSLVLEKKTNVQVRSVFDFFISLLPVL